MRDAGRLFHCLLTDVSPRPCDSDVKTTCSGTCTIESCQQRDCSLDSKKI